MKLTNDQFGELVQQYVEIQVDNMDRKTMEEWITDELIFKLGQLDDDELKEEINQFDEELYEELVDNVTTNTITNSQRWGFNQDEELVDNITKTEYNKIPHRY